MIDKVSVMNVAREKYRQEHDKKTAEEAKVLFEKYKNEALFIAGVALYWAEGTRACSHRKYQLAFTNSDPEMLRVYCNFLRRYFGNIDPALRVGLYLYKDIDEDCAKAFWSDSLRIPARQFIKSQVLPGKGTVFNKLAFGTCCVYLNSKDYLNMMVTWIGMFSGEMRV